MELGPYPDLDGHGRALELDRADALAACREAFVANDDPDLLYLDGNSLGMLPAAALAVVDDTVARQWGQRLIRSWNEGWWDAQVAIAADLAPVIGCEPDEVMLSESTSTNLFKLAVAACRARPDRHTIVTDDLNFPSDNHILAGVADLLGLDLVTVRSPDGVHGDPGALAAAIDESTALVSLSHVAYRSGWIWDVPSVTTAAHAAGAMVLWDCSHSVGVVPIELAEAGADLAVGCTYKYCNGGPGAPSWLYVRRDLHDQLSNPITGWWGHRDPFAMDRHFVPADGMRRFHVGTMPVLSLRAAAPGIALVAEAGIDEIRSKSVALTSLFIDLADSHLSELGFDLASPRDAARRGGHVSLRHAEAWAVTQGMLHDAHAIPDFRAPDVLRVGLSPLTTSFLDVHTAVGRLGELVASGRHRAHASSTATVT